MAECLGGRPLRGFVLDITGVLYNSSPSGLGEAIPGSVDAVNRLYSESQVRFVSNESTSTRAHLVAKLRKLGFSLHEEHVFSPISVALAYLRDNKLRPHLLVHKDVREEFASLNQEDANCVVMGDAEEDFNYVNLNRAFRVLQDLSDPLIVSLGCGKFYRNVDGVSLDVGAYAKALQYATGARIQVVGKPNESFFLAAIDDMGFDKDEVVMIGDDIETDVGAAMGLGMRAVQLRTGKWRAEWEHHAIKPTLIANSLKDAVDMLLPFAVK